MPRSYVARLRNSRGATCSRRLAAFLVFEALVVIAAGASDMVRAQEPLLPGQAFVTQFSGTTLATGADGVPRTVIDVNGASGVAIDLRAPGFAADGRHWMGEPDLFAATAGDVGQVFGVALDDAAVPNIYLTATALFGLHRNADNSTWMEGMWGRGGGPGTVFKLNAADGYRPEVFAEIALDGRPNSGAALGNIAFDRWNRQFYVSDLETGMIHRIGLADGADLGQYDHGVLGRSVFFDAVNGVSAALAQVAFDPATAAHVTDCPTGDFARTASCWNMADFRRRVFGLGVRRDGATGEVRLMYAVWSSRGFGNPAWPTAGQEQKNTLWSVAIDATGDFDLTSVRREAVLPDFFVAPEDIARSGYSHPVSDIAFPAFGEQTVMLVAERGGVRNLGLGAEDAFATPHEARVLRYEIDAQGVWQPVGRYDVGFYDRKDDSPPYIRANAAGGVAFGFGYDATGAVDPARPNAFVWMTGDGLCSPAGPCFNPDTGVHDDQAQVHGIEGLDQALYEPVAPDAAFQPYPSPGPATPASGPDSAFMVDSDIDIDAAGILIADLGRNDATRIGDVAIYQVAPTQLVRPAEGPWYGPWEGDWPWPVPTGDYPPLPAPPPGGAWPELALQKTAPAECNPGAPCTMTVTVTNNGPGVYSGPLHVLDTPGGTILSGYSVDWTCAQPEVGGAIGCRRAPFPLAAGQSTSLVLTAAWPLIGIAEEALTDQTNCAFIVWPGALEGAARVRAVEAALLLLNYETGPVDGVLDPLSQAAIEEFRAENGLVPGGGIDDALMQALFPGTSGMPGDGNPRNDWACAPIHIPSPAPPEPPGPPEVVPQGVQLQVHKEPIGGCQPGDRCNFFVTISNLGTEDYVGPVAITDSAQEFPSANLVAAEAIHAPAAMTCIPSGSGARCTVPGPVAIAPDDPVTFVIGVDVPLGSTAEAIGNCTYLFWPGMALPGPGGDGDLSNDFFCASADLVGAEEEEAPLEGFDLGVEKNGIAGACIPGGSCDFQIHVINHGLAAFHGPVVVNDFADVIDVGAIPAASISSLSADWICEEVTAEAVHCRSAADIDLEAEGGEVTFAVRVGLAADIGGEQFENCASIAWEPMALPEGRDDNPGNEERCAVEDINRNPAIDIDIGHNNVDASCAPGDSCRFTVEFGNRGDDNFQWTLAFDYTATLMLADGSHQAVPMMTSSFACAPGPEPATRCVAEDYYIGASAPEERSVDVQVQLPSGVDATELVTCAWIAWDAMAFPGDGDDNPGNDGPVCLIIPISQADLVITKSGPESGYCLPGRICEFEVEVVNTGDDPFDGRLAVTDTATRASGETIDLNLIRVDDPDWEGHVAGDDHWFETREAISLPLGGSVTFLVSLLLPSDYDEDQFENCVAFAWERVEVSDINADNNDFCIPVAVNRFDLRIGKYTPSGGCFAGQPCVFEVEIDNLGSGPFEGEIWLTETASSVGPGGGELEPSLIRSDDASWEAGLEPEFMSFNTRESVVLEDAPITLNVIVDVPPDFEQAQLENCAEIRWERMAYEQDQNDANDGFCVPVDVKRLDLAVTKSGPESGSCSHDDTCHFTFEVTNEGDDEFVGRLYLRESATVTGPGGGPIGPDDIFGGSDDWAAAVESVGGVETEALHTRDEVVLAPGDSISGPVGVFVAFGVDHEAVENCVALQWDRMDPPGDRNSTNDEGCITIPIAETPIREGADLGPGGATECWRGQECEFEVTIDNHGKKRFTGAAGIRGTLDPPVEITRVEPLTAGLICSPTGFGAYECLASKLVIEPGEAARFTVYAAIPTDFFADAITHTKDMVWPDAAAKDRNPGNDHKVTTITIEGPQRLQPAAAPDLAISTIARQTDCAAGQACSFAVTVASVGAGDYQGPLQVSDVVAPAKSRLTDWAPAPWSCRQSGGTVACSHPTTTLAPGASTTFALTFAIGPASSGTVENCAELSWTDATRTAVVQNALNQLGFDAGPVDGKVGPRTHGAVHAFEESAGLPATGKIRPELLQSLFGTWAVGDADAANDRSCATVALTAPVAPAPQAAPLTPAPPSPPASSAVQPSITCTDGSVQNGECVCPQGTLRQQMATNSYRCVTQAVPGVAPIVPQLTCQGGTVEQGQCVCPAGKERKQVLPGVFRCETVSIQCGGGTIENNQCVCPQGTQVQLRATNIYKCVPVAPAQAPAPEEPPTVTPSAPSAASPITCQGGNVQNNQCVCGPGKRRQQTGTNAYRCVPIIQNPLRQIIPKLLQR